LKQIAIIYFSQTDTTHNLALAVAQGCAAVSDTEVVSYRILAQDIEQGRFQNLNCLELVDNSDAVVFGSPTFMGGPAAQFKAFADASSECWESQRWSGKLAAGFTVGSSPSGDQLGTLQLFALLAAQHGMLWLGLDIADNADQQGLNDQGCQLGLAAHCITPQPSAGDIRTAQYLGARVAKFSHRLLAE